MATDATKLRNQVGRIAPSDPAEALRQARRITDPWFLCQALATVALHTRDSRHRLAILDESLVAGRLAGDPNRVATVSSWPLKVLCESGEPAARLKLEVASLLSTINKEPSPVRRQDALSYLLGAVLNAPRGVFWEVFEALIDACNTRLASGKRNARGESLMALWAPVIWQFDAARGQALIEAIEGHVLRSRAIAAIGKMSGEDARIAITWPNLH